MLRSKHTPLPLGLEASIMTPNGVAVLSTHRAEAQGRAETVLIADSEHKLSDSARWGPAQLHCASQT